MPKLRSVRLLVDDFPSNFKYYRDVLKFPIAWGDEGGPYAEFQASDDVSIALFQKELMADLLKEEGEGGVSKEDNFMLIFKADGSTDEDFDVLAPHSKVLVGPTDREGWGVRTCHLRTPDESLIEVNKGFEE